MAKKKLNAKQLAFCHEYIIDFNATEAAKRAGYSENTARFVGCENLTKPNIKQKIKELTDNFVKNRTDLKVKVVRELEHIAFARISNCYDDEGDLKPLLEWGEAEKAALQQLQIKHTRYGTDAKIKNYDKTAAIEKLLVHLGLFEDGEGVKDDNGIINIIFNEIKKKQNE